MPEQHNPRGWWWLSFCEVDRPKGEQFVGCAIVFADSPELAPLRAHHLGINPGGEVAMVKLYKYVPRRFRNRFLEPAEAQRVRLKVR